MGDLVYAPVALIAAWVAVSVASLGLGRTPADLGDAWPTRARQVYPARLASTAITLMAPLVCGMVLLIDPRPVDVPTLSFERVPLAIGVAVGGFAGALIAGWQRERRVVPGGTRLAVYARGWSWWVVWFGPLVVVPAAGMYLAYFAPDIPLAVIVGVTLCLLVALSLGGLHMLWRAVGLACIPRAELRAAMSDAATAAGAPVPPVFELRLGFPNAFALPLLGVVYVTRGALATLARDELVGVLQHELGHLAQRMAFRRMLTFGLVALACLISLPRAQQQLGVAGALLVAVPFMLILYLNLRRRHALEHGADTHAHRDAPAYARALVAIHRASLIPVVLGAATHPDLYDRLEAAGAPPDYERPARPSRRALYVRFAAGLLAGGAVAVAGALAAARL